MDTGKIVAGVLAGVAVGALLGVLFAPDKGSETRRKIAKMGSDTLDDLQDKAEGSLGNVKEKFDMFKDDTHGIYDKGKHKADEIRKEIKPQMS